MEVELSIVAYERALRERKWKFPERPFTSHLTPKDRKRIVHLKSILKQCIRYYAHIHAFRFWHTLRREAKRQNVDVGGSIGHAVLVLNFHTYITGEQLYWKPLFQLLKSILKIFIPRIHDEEIWDIIIPLGYRELQRVRKRYPPITPMYYLYPIPALYRETPTKKKS